MKFLKRRKLILCLVVVLCFFVAAAIYFGHYMKRVNSYQDTVRSTVISDVDISAMPDGSYIGEYDVDFIYAKVEVTVLHGKILDIVILEHRNDRGNTAESITHSIIAHQKLDVDAVSGATNSSTVLKKAIELALIDGINTSSS